MRDSHKCVACAGIGIAMAAPWKEFLEGVVRNCAVSCSTLLSIIVYFKEGFKFVVLREKGKAYLRIRLSIARPKKVSA